MLRYFSCFPRVLLWKGGSAPPPPPFFLQNTDGTGALKGLTTDKCTNIAVPNVCDGTLKKVKGTNGKPLIDCGTPPASTANLKLFRENIFQWFGDNVNVLGGAAIGFGVVQLLAIVFACFIMCKNKEEFDATA